jgi:integrase
LEGKYSAHEFRHAAASLWIEQRVDPKRIQTWMGHSSIQVTFDTYGHLFERAEGDAATMAAVEAGVLGANATQVQHAP